MLRIIRRLASGVHDVTLTLPLEKRVKARLRVELDDGREAGLFLDRGPILRGGQLLEAEDGTVVQIIAAPEALSVVKTGDALHLAQACYHLGNRHVPVQILSGEVRYQHDHVLDNMLVQLDLEPCLLQLPFEPEPGAYGEHGSEHAHGHSHSHTHSHGHSGDLDAG
jgi:urease accessory protein